MPPLHLCTEGHAAFFYAGEACPYCALRKTLIRAKQRIAILEAQLRQEAGQPRPQTQTQEPT